MKVLCPYCSPATQTKQKVLKFGRFYRKSQKKWIQRYKCSLCKHHFSSSTKSFFVGQNKRHLNFLVFRLLVSGVSQRRIARLLKIHPITVQRILIRMAHFSRLKQTQLLKNLSPTRSFQFDDLETFEHTRLKPLSVTMAVESDSRFILGFEVSRMPAKGLLAKRSRKKYGKREDQRKEKRQRLFKRIKAKTSKACHILSDESPFYTPCVREHFPLSLYKRVKGRRGCVTGQGELKRGGFDPLFSLNHSFAMLRANINRLFRRSWNTTKDPNRLRDHIDLYVWYHNSDLIRA